MASAEELGKLRDEFLAVTAVGIARELFGDEIADKFRRSLPNRERLIDFILNNQP